MILRSASGLLIGWYARIIVHEATHGEIQSRGVNYTPELRPRVEQLCVKEEQRFVAKLGLVQPQLADWLRRDFDASLWAWSWNATCGERLRAQFRRMLLSGDD